MKREKIKTILCHLAVITICMGVFCHGYINGVSLSGNDRLHCYAEADNWSTCDSSDLVTAFRYYCKSRNLAIEGSFADALTSFTTTTFNNICSTLGIDPTSLQAELKKTTQGNLGLRFLFSNTGITAYNRIFAEFLQNNDLSVGDKVENKELYLGDYFTDNQGNSCLVYVISSRDNALSFDKGFPNPYIKKYGTPYRFIGKNFFNSHSAGTYSYSVNNLNFDIVVYEDRVNVSIPNGLIYRNTTQSSNYAYQEGNCAIVKFNNEYYLGVYSKGSKRIDQNNNVPSFICERVLINATSSGKITDAQVTNTDISVTTNNTTINNNVYNNNYTIIYNEGDTYVTDDPDEPLPTTPPGGGDPGGGGGDDPGGEPDNWNPTTPEIPDPSSPDFPSVELPDIDIPDLPSLNFSLGDLREKFPFSLPFDIIAVLNVLDGEPQAPHIQATVPIGKWYTWEMDFDFSEFDNYARIFRAFEFIGFVIGLAVFTVHFAKG